MRTSRNNAILACIALLAATCTRGVAAQRYPDHPIRFVVGFSAGGNSDIVARLLGQKVSQYVGQPVIVDNRPGAASNIAAEIAAKAPPDGYTILLGSISLATSATLYTKLNYDALRDLAAVTQLTINPYMLVIHPSLPVKNVKELIALAKAKPGYLSYASAGSGSGAHLFAELFRDMAGINIVHVPYKGSPPATTDVVNGQVPMQFDNVITALPLAKTGKLRPLAVTTTKRLSITPDVPTIAEAGVPGYNANSWFGVFAPASTPQDVVAKLHAEVVKALQTQELRERLLALGNEPVGSTPEEYSKFFRAEVAKWASVIKKVGVKVD